MKRWAKPVAILAATALAVAAATGAYAMSAGGKSSPPPPMAASPTPTAIGMGAPRTLPAPDAHCAAIEPCGAPVPVAPELTCEEAHACGGATDSCPSAGRPCDNIAYTCNRYAPGPKAGMPPPPCPLPPCASGAPCVEPRPGVMPPPLVCTQDMPISACYSDARPAGPYVCEAPAPDAASVCHPPACTPQLPSPPSSAVSCMPPLPAPPCAIAATPCGCVMPMRADGVPCEPPPGCAISSDGVTACAVPPPSPTCPDGVACSSPGAPPAGGSGGGVAPSATVSAGVSGGAPATAR